MSSEILRKQEVVDVNDDNNHRSVEDAVSAAAAEAAVEAVMMQHEAETAEAVAAALEVDEEHSLANLVMQRDESTPSYVVAAATQPPDALSAMQEAATLVMQAREEEAMNRKRKNDLKVDGECEEEEAHEASEDSETTKQVTSDVAAVAAAVAAVDNKAETPAANTEDASRPPPRKKRAPPIRLPWDERISELKAYKAAHGNLLIPIRYKPNPSLGKFVHNTREQYKLFHKKTPEGYKKKCSMTAARIAELEEIGFVWTTERNKRQDEDWSERIKQLEEYKAKHGVSEFLESKQVSHAMITNWFFSCSIA